MELDDMYWVIPGYFLAGPYPGSQDERDTFRCLRSILQKKITYFIDLTEQGENGLKPYAVQLMKTAAESNMRVVYNRFSIQDMGIPSTDQMRQILDSIDSSLAGKQNIYLHCLGGLGRTGTVVGCYLVRHGNSGEEGIARLAILRRNTPNSWRSSPETIAQHQFILDWKE